jgi:hypothetical protein
MSAMKNLEILISDNSELSWAERDLIMSSVRDFAKQEAGVDFAHAYMAGMMMSVLTDDQIRKLARVAHS